MNSSANSVAVFDQLQQIAREQGVKQSLDFLEQQFRSEKQFFQLFEVLKMQVRHEMQLPLTYGSQADELDDERQRQLEDGLLEACAEVGELLIKNGRLEEGWMYLQPVGDRKRVENIINNIPVDEENIEMIIEVAVSQGAAPAYGYGLVMQHYGTCNAITTFDTQATRFDRPTQKAMAVLLVRHLYQELCANLNHIVEREGKQANHPNDLSELLAEHPWLIEGGAHHIDTTHLASVMKIARIVDSVDDLQLALKLAHYGLGLHADFQYASSAPFEETYPDHLAFFGALLGLDIDTAVKHFESKCESVDPERFGPVAFETLVDLLVRLGRKEQAIRVLTEKVIGKFEPMGIAPHIFQIADSPAELDIAREFFREQQDLLSFGISILK